MSEPRWIRQRDKYSCGPIVIANALKWAGVGFSWANSGDALGKLCMAEPNGGTHENDMERALRKLGGNFMTIKRRRKWKLAEIIDHVESRGAVIFDYTIPSRDNMAKPTNERDGHYAFCADIMGEGKSVYFKLINLVLDDTITWVDRNWFKWMFMARRYDDRAWFLRTKE